MRFFFYGTLLDEDVRRIVLGPLAPAMMEPATLAGWRRAPIVGVSYPMIVRDPRARVAGALARGLDDAARDLLVRYEDVDYDLIGVGVETALGRTKSCFVFAPKAGRMRRGTGSWTFAGWQRRHKQDYVAEIGASRRAPKPAARRP